MPLPIPKQYTYFIGGKKGTRVRVTESEQHLIIRGKFPTLAECITGDASRKLLASFYLVDSLPESNVFILRVRSALPEKALEIRNKARKLFPEENGNHVYYTGRLYTDSLSQRPVIYTQHFFIKFHHAVTRAHCLRILKRMGLRVAHTFRFAENAFYVKPILGQKHRASWVFRQADTLLGLPEVEFCHPEIVRVKGWRTISNRHWHLKPVKRGNRTIDAHIAVEPVHKAGILGNKVTIAIIDDGVDILHPELKGKVVHPFNAETKTDKVISKELHEGHGTCCAGVALAAGKYQATGVAPAAALMPIRCYTSLGSVEEIQAIEWAVKKGADIISCSWGAEDGKWFNAEDPLHNEITLLPDMMRLVVQHAVRKGRKGRGCIITWAAGNGNEPADNDGYAANPNVITVAACNDRGKRSVYSDYGKSIWVCFPSNDFKYKRLEHPAPITKGIWTIDRRGKAGDNKRGDYTASFGGTSSACPGVAGVCALILEANPRLTHTEVKDILRRSADRIDSDHGHYDRNGHSHWYGFGRVNAARAVNLALSWPGAIAHPGIDVPPKRAKRAKR